MRHSPGPWTFDDFDGRIFIFPVKDSCFYIAEMIDPRTDAEGRYPGPKTRLANAALIAAAPDMLKALRAAEERFATLADAEEATNKDLQVWQQIRATIAQTERK
jgi:hypothetical protein